MGRCGLFLLFLASSMPAFAQTTGAGYAEAPSPSLASVARIMHTTIRHNLADAAASMPGDEYGFRPTADTRTFAQLIGHVINANNFFCAQAAGDTANVDSTNYEQVRDKATLVKALEASLTRCDRAHAATSDANFNQPVSVAAGVGEGPAKTVRGAVLMFNVAHNNEHYGNVVVYMRLKGHVPPSTANVRSPK